MARVYLKKAEKTAKTDAGSTQDIVRGILSDIEEGREKVALEISAKFDKYSGNAILTRDEIDEAKQKIPQKLRDDMHYAHDNIMRFALAQKGTMSNMEMELHPGLITGQKLIPVNAAGCYVPGGRYAHIASAMMTVTTAKAAGVGHITACSPPNGDEGINPAIIYAADLAGADKILSLGGVQGVASMTYGLFDLPEADIIVGPGNQFVAEAKRQLFGRVGIDMIAGPTDSLILADANADADIVACDLVGQAEHGYNSPAWLYTTSKELAEKVIKRVPELIADLPELPKTSAEAAWRDYGEVVLCDNDEEMATISDKYAPEHLELQTENLKWFHNRLKNYGSLFVGEETTVAYGDKCSGTNHILPTKGAGRYTGGLFVGKFIKTLSFQRMTKESTELVGAVAARLSRYEGMEAHARTADARLRKYGFSN